MREPSWEIDGWDLDSGEARHAEAPTTFWIPERRDREELKPGDLAQLIFRIAVDDDDDPYSVERMWVIVRERIADAYLGILNNQPATIAENEEFWVGSEVPFRAEHVIDISSASNESIDLAAKGPRRAWPRD